MSERGRHRAVTNAPGVRAKHRGSEHRFGSRKIAAIAALAAVAAGALVYKAPELDAYSMKTADKARAAIGPHVTADQGSVPRDLPGDLRESITENTFKYALSHEGEKGVTGTAFRVGNKTVTAAHVEWPAGIKPNDANCEGGMITGREKATTVLSRSAIHEDMGKDIAVIQGSNAVDFGAGFPLATRAPKIGEVVFAAGFPPVNEHQERGPAEYMANNPQDPDKYTYPVITAAVSIGRQFGMDAYLMGIAGYGEGSAKDVKVADHGMSGGPLVTQRGEAIGVVDKKVKMMSEETVERIYGLTIDHSASAPEIKSYQVIYATPAEDAWNLPAPQPC